MLNIVIKESNLFQTKLILRWAKINLFKFFRRIFSRIFCEFNIGYPNDNDVSFRLSKIVDSSKPGNSTSVEKVFDVMAKTY